MISVEEYKDHVRTLPCLICGGAAEPHHLVSVGMGRKRETPKWEDCTIIPLSRRYHAELHQIGRKTFEKKHYINLYKEALIILAKWIFHKSKLQKENNGKRDQKNRKN